MGIGAPDFSSMPGLHMPSMFQSMPMSSADLNKFAGGLGVLRSRTYTLIAIAFLKVCVPPGGHSLGRTVNNRIPRALNSRVGPLKNLLIFNLS